MKTLKYLSVVSGGIFSTILLAQTPLRPQEQMAFIGAYNSGQPDVNIYKMYDKAEDVLCYIMMPTYAQKKQLENGQTVYEANTVGVLSCMKVKTLPTILERTNVKK